jgi:hypothetical protein
VAHTGLSIGFISFKCTFFAILFVLPLGCASNLRAEPLLGAFGSLHVCVFMCVVCVCVCSVCACMCVFVCVCACSS